MNKILKATALPNGRLHVALQDGRYGEFDVKPFMKTDFFAKLKDESYFQQVRLFFSGVGWPDGQDIGPDTVASHLTITTLS